MMTRNRTDVMCKDLNDYTKKGAKVPFKVLLVFKDKNLIKGTEVQIYHRYSFRTADSAGLHHEMGVQEMLLTVGEAVGPVSTL